MADDEEPTHRVVAIDGGSTSVDGSECTFRFKLSDGQLLHLEVPASLMASLLSIVSTGLADAQTNSQGARGIVAWQARHIRFERLEDGSIGLRVDIHRGPAVYIATPAEDLQSLRLRLQELEAEQTETPGGLRH